MIANVDGGVQSDSHSRVDDFENFSKFSVSPCAI